MSIFGYRKTDDGYFVTKDGKDYIHTGSLPSAAKIVDDLTYDTVTLCEINKCTDCQRYGKDCDGRNNET